MAIVYTLDCSSSNASLLSPLTGCPHPDTFRRTWSSLGNRCCHSNHSQSVSSTAAVSARQINYCFTFLQTSFMHEHSMQLFFFAFSLTVCLQSSLPRACRRLGGRRATSSWPSLGASPRAIVVSLAPCFHFLSLPFSIMQPSSVDIKVKHLVIIRHSLCTPVPDHFLYCSAVPLFLLTASTALPWKHH